jgi:hypothetical protein
MTTTIEDDGLRAAEQWRDLALQFDGHRIEALSLLRYVAEARNTVEVVGRVSQIAPFLAKPPLSGEAVLAERLAALRSSPAEPEMDLWPDDPAPIADKAADHVFKDFAKALGLETWSPQDGSETWEGDVWATCVRMLEDAGVIDPETGELRSSPAVDGVGVKPLVWRELTADRGDGAREPNGDWEAETPLGFYEIEMIWVGEIAVWGLTYGTGNGYIGGDWHSPDDAKAAAQADYETRVRSALSPTSDRASVDPADLQLLMQLKRDNVWDGARSVVESDFEQCFRLSDVGLIALEQVAQGVRLHITRLGVKAIDAALSPRSS